MRSCGFAHKNEKDRAVHILVYVQYVQYVQYNRYTSILSEDRIF